MGEKRIRLSPVAAPPRAAGRIVRQAMEAAGARKIETE
jgi:hypothetical protein